MPELNTDMSMNMLWTFLGAIPIFALELLFLYIWFSKIYLVEIKMTPSIFFRRLKEVHQSYRDLWKGKIVDEEFKKFLKESLKFTFEISIISSTAFLFSVALVASMALVSVIESISRPYLIPAVLFTIIILISFLLGLFKKYYKDIVLKLDNFNQMYKFYKKYQRGSKFQSNTTLNKDKSKGKQQSSVRSEDIQSKGAKFSIFFLLAMVLFLIPIIAVLAVDGFAPSFNLEELFDLKHLIIYALFASSFLMLLLDRLFLGETTIEEIKDKIGKKLPFQSKEKGNIKVLGLDPWREDIYRMCKKSKVNSIKIICYDGNGGAPAFSFFDRDNCQLTIALDGQSLNRCSESLNPSIFYGTVLFLIGHELGHIYYGDLFRRTDKKLILESLIVTGGGFFVSFLFIKFNPLLGVIPIIVFFFYMFFVVLNSFEDECYWGQIDELRADRFGIWVSETNSDIFEQFCLFFEKDAEKRSTEKINRRKGIIYKIYNFGRNSRLLNKILGTHPNADRDVHPYLKTRINEIKRHEGKRFQTVDYLRYAWRFSWSLHIKKDWRF